MNITNFICLWDSTKRMFRKLGILYLHSLGFLLSEVRVHACGECCEVERRQNDECPDIEFGINLSVFSLDLLARAVNWNVRQDTNNTVRRNCEDCAKTSVFSSLCINPTWLLTLIVWGFWMYIAYVRWTQSDSSIFYFLDHHCEKQKKIWKCIMKLYPNVF